jgi:hypothetical protein
VNIHPSPTYNIFEKTIVECSKRRGITVDEVYLYLEVWHHPESERGKMLEKLKIFNEVGS